MKKTFLISSEDARNIALQAQGLFSSAQKKNKKDTLQIINQLGYVQIDTLAVVERAHHHCLWSRNINYSKNHLNDLHEKDKSVFEYWSHAAAYLPMEDYRFSLPRKQLYLEGKQHWFKADKKTKKYVLDRIKNEGELMARNFEHPEKSNSWFDWKPAKAALEQLFMEGKLMISKRKGFQKVYDLAENVLPKNINSNFPTESEYATHIINKAIQAHGIITEQEICYLRSNLKPIVSKEIKRMLKDGELIIIEVEGNEKQQYYSNTLQLKKLNEHVNENGLHILSPFDNLIIQRKRTQQLFNFDYQVECYVPAAKRKFGYFCLPVLYGNNFVARIDAKADRHSKKLIVNTVFFEKGFKKTPQFNSLLNEKLKQFAQFNGVEY